MNALRRSFYCGVVVALGAITTLSFTPDANADPASQQLPGGPSSPARYVPHFGRVRPVVAVVAENAGTELIDFVIPYGVLAESGAADVRSVATHDAPVRMLPAMKLRPQDSTASFDEAYPDGADFVVVPAVAPESKAGNPTLIAWLQAQADRGATIVSICDGALIVAKAGLFAGHRATGHWATQKRREKAFPDVQWLTNTRYVIDGDRISSAGVTAALPLSIALVEAIAGRDKAAALAARLGVNSWSAEHDSQQFRLGGGVYWTALRNWILPHQDIELPVATGIPEVELALMTDAFSRTFRSHAVLVASSADDVRTRNGLVLVPDRTEPARRSWRPVEPGIEHPPTGQTLDWTLARIGEHFGPSTARFVALQLEYAP